MEMIQNENTFCTSKAGLTGISGGATTFSTGSLTLQYCILGKAYNLTQQSGAATPTTDIVTGVAFVPLAANQGTVWVFGVDASGTVSIGQGSIEALDSAGAFYRAPQFPIVPDTVCPFAYVVAKDGSTGGAFTVGTTNWNVTGMTYSVQDIFSVPTRPQIA